MRALGRQWRLLVFAVVLDQQLAQGIRQVDHAGVIRAGSAAVIRRRCIRPQAKATCKASVDEPGIAVIRSTLFEDVAVPSVRLL